MRAIPFMNGVSKGLPAHFVRYKAKLDEDLSKNPYGVLIATGTWGGSGLRFAVHMYFLHQAFPGVSWIGVHAPRT